MVHHKKCLCSTHAVTVPTLIISISCQTSRIIYCCFSFRVQSAQFSPTGISLEEISILHSSVKHESHRTFALGFHQTVLRFSAKKNWVVLWQRFHITVQKSSFRSHSLKTHPKVLLTCSSQFVRLWKTSPSYTQKNDSSNDPSDTHECTKHLSDTTRTYYSSKRYFANFFAYRRDEHWEKYSCVKDHFGAIWPLFLLRSLDLPETLGGRAAASAKRTWPPSRCTSGASWMFLSFCPLE